jgi:CubicO group peptidase (beta-lactamase class C family)
MGSYVMRKLLPAAAVVATLAASPATGTAATSCKPPGAGKEWKRASAASVDLDAAAVKEALALATTGAGSTAAVYRHGCLVETKAGAGGSRDRTYESWSSGKSAVSLAAGRAMTLGLLSPDDRVGALIPEADREHGALTVRQLLEMASGLHWNFIRDYSQSRTENRVNDALTLPFDHKPGTYFEYAQSTVALTAEVVARAADVDFQTFVHRELFTPIGIERGSWTWLREGHGHTLGFMGLQLRPRDYARLGQLMLQRGVWGSKRVLSEDFVEAATTPSRANPGYGWFWWVNRGTRFIGPTIEGRSDFARRLVESAPADMFSAIGFGDQWVMVFPSLDMVLTRSSPSGGGNPTGQAELKHNVVQVLMRAARDKRVPSSGPFAAKGPITPRDPDYGIGGSGREPEHVAAALETPALPPRGPAVARAVQLAGSAVHASRVELRASRDGRVRVKVACPKVGKSNCRGTLSLARGGKRLAKPVAFDIPRGRASKLTLTLSSGLETRLISGALKATTSATAGATTTTADARISAP